MGNTRPDNGRTHEPSLRELTGQLDDLKELMKIQFDSSERLMEERDTRYLDRFQAMDEKTSLALTSSKEAVTKAEVATEKRFDSVNEFRNTLRDQATLLMPRSETETKFLGIEEKIEDLKKEIITLREYKSQSTGQQISQNSSQLQSHWVIGIVIAILLGIGAMVVSILK
jgi:hypothetical protein